MPLDFIAAMRASAASKKGKVSVVAVKQVSKALTGMGKTVAAVELHPDGSYTVVASDPDKPSPKSVQDFWKKKLAPK